MTTPTPAAAPTKPYKAVIAFVLAFLGALTATLQGRTDLESMKLVDWLIVVGTALVTAAGTYAVANPPKVSSWPPR